MLCLFLPYLLPKRLLLFTPSAPLSCPDQHKQMAGGRTYLSCDLTCTCSNAQAVPGSESSEERLQAAPPTLSERVHSQCATATGPGCYNLPSGLYQIPGSKLALNSLKLATILPGTWGCHFQGDPSMHAE